MIAIDSRGRAVKNRFQAENMKKAGHHRHGDTLPLFMFVRVLYRPPNSSYSNPILYEKGFGYVFCLQEVLRKDYSER